MKHLLIPLLFLSACGKGDPGTDGTAGTNGTNGKNGTSSLTVTSDVKCDGTSILGVGLHYEVIHFTGNAQFVTCNVYDTSRDHGRSYYLPNTPAGTCYTVYDIQTASGGYWSFSYSGSTYQAQYIDPGSANDGVIYTFSSCVAL